MIKFRKKKTIFLYTCSLNILSGFLFFFMHMDSEIGDHVEEKAVAINGDSWIDVNEGDDGSRKGEKVCRICHFGKDNIMTLGCDCKGELGCHRHCADLWFNQKGDTVCEICGKTAKNVGNNAGEETSIFMMEWDEMREVVAALDASGENRHRCNQCFCHCLLACFILLFMLLWFFRGIKIL